MPLRPLTLVEAIVRAELQGSRLLELCDVTTPPVPETIITTLPKLRVDRLSPIPVSGSTHWARGRWVIVLNGAEPPVRQRFSLAHEFKHVIDHPFVHFLYPDQLGMSARDRREQMADYFAACLLMPRAWVKRLYCDQSVQNLSSLARHFGVSKMAMNIRLLQLGLVEPPQRCDRSEYHREGGDSIVRTTASLISSLETGAAA